MPVPQERQLFLQGGNGSRDSNLVLSTDAKPRLKWTPDLHERFVEAVNQLGGADSMSVLTCTLYLTGVCNSQKHHKGLLTHFIPDILQRLPRKQS